MTQSGHCDCSTPETFFAISQQTAPVVTLDIRRAPCGGKRMQRRDFIALLCGAAAWLISSRSVDFLILGLWTLAIIVGLILYSMPFFLIAMMIALAVGFPAWAALTVFPITVIAMVYLFCVIASRRMQ
jgi:hypothetical protein